jgi:hypothetical protein
MKTTIRLITTSLFGLALMAYAQNNNAAVPKVQAAAPQADKSKESMPMTATFDPWLGNVTSTYAYAGSSYYQEKTIDVYGFNFGTYYPAAISCQPRQSVNYDYGYPDAFSCQVIYAGNTYIRVRVRRLDSASGWGQNLRLDFIVFSAINN